MSRKGAQDLKGPEVSRPPGLRILQDSDQPFVGGPTPTSRLSVLTGQVGILKVSFQPKETGRVKHCDNLNSLSPHAIHDAVIPVNDLAE